MFLRHATKHALEHHRLIDRAQRIVAMMQRDLELAGRVFGHQRLGGQTLRGGRGVHVVEHRRQIVEALQAVGVYLLALAGAATTRGDEPATGLFLQ